MTTPSSGLQRGEVYLLDFSPASGHEMTGPHPCVIVQNDIGNQFSSLSIVVAVTSNLRVASLPIGVRISAGVGGLRKESVIHCGHVYTVDKKRLAQKLGELPADMMQQVDRALALSLGLAR